MKKIILLFLMFAGLNVFAGERPITGAEMLELQLKSREMLKFPESGWRFIYTDKKEFADPDFDDSAWNTVRVNTPLSGKNRPESLPDNYRKAKNPCWYRYTFELPEGVPGNNFELRMGQISRGDLNFVNGHLTGTYGFDRIMNRSSSKERIYFSSGSKKILRPGKNVIAVRCKIGHLRGMHSGIVELRKLPELLIHGRYAHRSKGATAVCRQITGRKEVNQFLQHEKIFCRPELTIFSTRSSYSGELSMVLSKAGNVIWQKKLPLTLKPGKYVSPDPQQLPPLESGEYKFTAQFSGQGKNLWKSEIPVKVAPAKKFNLTANAELAKFNSKKLPLDVSSESFGSFGPRNVNRQKQLFDDYSRPDTRSTPVFLMISGPHCRGALLGLSHVKTTPNGVGLRQVSHSIGGRFDHFTDMWVAGEVIAAGKREAAVPKTDSVWWTGRKITYTYPSGGSFSMTGSVLSPALVFETGDLPSLLFFAPTKWKTGVPTKLYVPGNGKLKAVTSIKPEADFMVASFEGNPAYDEFNIPILIVFEKRPKLVKLIGKGIRTFFENSQSGKIYVMPLYGVTLQEPGLPADALAAAEKWSRILPNLPERVSRTAKVDYQNNRLLFQDKYQWNNGKVPKKSYLPVPPTLLLAQRGGMKISVSENVKDLDLATMAGPFAAVCGGDSVTWAIDGVVNYVREIRETVDIADNPKSREARARLEETVRKIAAETSRHPWQFIAKRKGKGEIGGLQPGFSNLLIALEYLPENLKKQIHADIIKEMPLSIFNDDFQIPGRKPGTVVPINTKVFSPLANRTFSMLTRHHLDNGIDCPCWEALRLIIYEHAGRACNADDLLKKNWQQILYSYYPIINSHDWAYSASWDSYGGIRVGNGFQENTIFHAGLIAYARMTRRFGMIEESDKAAYHASLQLVGTKSCASPSTLDYLRQVRPMLASAKHFSIMENLENLCPYHNLEINERTGFYHTLINAESSYDSHGFIMTRLPEIMRPFKEVWGDYSTAHINFVRPNGKTMSHITPPPVDQFFYLTDVYPYPIEKLIEIRLTPGIRKGMSLWEQLADDRAALEIHGKNVYRKLW